MLTSLFQKQVLLPCCACWGLPGVLGGSCSYCCLTQALHASACSRAMTAIAACFWCRCSRLKWVTGMLRSVCDVQPSTLMKLPVFCFSNGRPYQHAYSLTIWC